MLVRGGGGGCGGGPSVGGDKKTTLNIQWRRYQWDRQFRNNGVVAFIAPRGSGKSTLIRYVLYELRRRWDLAVAFVGSPEAASSMRAYIHPSFIFYGCDTSELNDRLEAVVDESEAMAAKGTPRRICIILEDLGDDRKFMRANPALKRICARGRHSGITLVFSAQQAHQLPPDVRANIDALTCLFTKGEERESIRKAFFGSLSKSEFDFVVGTLCRDFQAIVLDTTHQSGDVSNSVFFTKAPLTVPRFSLLSPVFRAIAEQSALSSDDAREREEQQRNQRKLERAKRFHKRGLATAPPTQRIAVAIDRDTIEVRNVANVEDL